jgi:hypothetical protein
MALTTILYIKPQNLASSNHHINKLPTRLTFLSSEDHRCHLPHNMHYTTILTLTATTASLVTASPFSRLATPNFTPGLVWDMILDRSHITLPQLKTAPGTVIDIDLLDVIDAKPALQDIKELAKTKKVICYFSAGSYETWRADAGSYARKDWGAPLDPEWANECWVDVRSSNVRAIVKKRIERAAAAGCHAVDPDNVDGYVSLRNYMLRRVC